MQPSDPGRLNAALTIFQEFGPARAIPVQKRWRDAFPDADEAALAAWETLFQELERFAYSIAERSLRGDLDARESCRMIGKAYSWLDSDHVDRIYSQAMYFAAK